MALSSRTTCRCGYEYRCHCSSKKYGCLGFLGDVVMTIVTGGLWLIWIFVREMRRR